MLSESVKREIKERFEAVLEREVGIATFVGPNCQYCGLTLDLMKELASLSDLINLQVYDVARDAYESSQFGIYGVPAIAILDGDRDTNIRYFGIPAGYEFGPIVGIIEDVGAGRVGEATRLPKKIKEKLSGVRKRVVIREFVTPSCPYCPKVATIIFRFALFNENIRSEVVEAMEFTELADKWNVQGVPHTVFNDREDLQLVGAYPIDYFAEYALKASE
ncbi:MAG TPA: hypothetical protein ENF35_02620 [Aciduliprofundum sp.]|nr:hypothetical protein [Aciduliprofundum sp.]